MYKVGDTVAAPVCKVFSKRKPARSKYGYDVGTVISTGKHKKTGQPAVKVSFVTADSVWVKRITRELLFEKWCLEKDVDKI